MKKGWVAAIILWFGLASPANADWQFTRWGMSPKEVFQASGGYAKLVPIKWKQGQYLGNSGPYASGALKFEANYVFGRLGLVEVALIMRHSASCEGLSDNLLELYGSPNYTSPMGPVYKWSIPSKNLKVEYLYGDAKSGCFVEYQPFISREKDGL